MYRYIALMWNRNDREADVAATHIAQRLIDVSPHDWSQAWDGEGLMIYHSNSQRGRMQTYLLHSSQGVVLGRLFKNDYSSVVDDFDEIESQRCIDTGGQHLISNYWGRYVAFLNVPKTATRYIMRDPTGAFPCYYTKFRGVTVYFSDMQDIANLEFLPFTIDWEFIQASFALRLYQKTITGLKEVGEVLPAECVEISPFEETSRIVWNPAEVAERDTLDNPEEAVALLRHTVKSTFGALGACYDSVVLYLGGLDSSILLACLAQAPNRPEIICYTEFTKSPRGDERNYSRQVAEKYDVLLVESELESRKLDLDRISNFNKCVDPTHLMESMDMTGGVLELGKERNAQAFFSGLGGDNVFYQMPSNAGALDFVRRNGLCRRNILRVALEASRRGRKTILSTLSEMVREYFIPESCCSYAYRQTKQSLAMPFVSPSFESDEQYNAVIHPLLAPRHRDLKGKFQQIRSCAFQHLGYYDCWDTDYVGERIHAYLSQPIIELCLRIPIWVLTLGGVERGLARRAFWDDLPDSVARRYSKSTPADFYEEVFSNNVNAFRETLLNGVLVGQGILRGDRLEQAFAGKAHFGKLKYSDLLGYLATEKWIKGWLKREENRAEAKDIAV